MSRRPLPPVRSTHTGVAEADAACSDCQFTAEGKNALGLGNVHARRTGHEVVCSQTIVAVYNRNDGAGAPERRGAATDRLFGDVP